MISSWKASYVIHVAGWLVLCIVALMSQSVAHFPVVLIFVISAMMYSILAWVTGATDPFWMEEGGTHIPDVAWQILNVAILFFLILWAIFIIRQWKTGGRWPLHFSLHAFVGFLGFISLTLVGSINYPFRL